MMNRCLIGDCRDSMRQLIADGVRVQTCVTSPPYFGLRDYGVDGQIGLENSPDEYIANMVEVFRLVRDLLADDGTLWLNIGDSYAGSWSAQGRPQGNGEMAGRSVTSARQIAAHPRFKRNTGTIGAEWGCKPKDLIGIPWMLAFALRADGWYLRQDIIWHKPNPMPESVRDRCTKAHEYVFLLSKSERYYFDSDAMKEPCVQDEQANTFRGGSYVNNEIDNATMGKRKVPGNKSHKGQAAYEAGDERHRTKAGLVAYAERALADDAPFGYRNKRSVWTIGSEPYTGAHFATFPTALVEPCIMAGSRVGDIVFDPFLGSGTTAEVAQKLGRDWIGCELNPAYAELQHKRTQQQGLELTP